MPATLSPEISQGVRSGAAAPAGLSADEKKAYDVLVHFFATGTAYAQEMGLRPQTLYAIEDSPVGLAAWMIDHDERSYELIERAFVGQAGGISRDDVLDNVTHYWLTKIGDLGIAPVLGEPSRLLRHQGRRHPGRRDGLPGRALSGSAEVGREGVPETRSITTGWTEGGHFAAWEQPAVLSEEIRATFRSLR